MDFGIFNLMQQRGANVTSADLVDDAIRHTRIAESLGFGRAWFAEHHFSNYSLCPSPLMMVAHAAAVTERIRHASRGEARGACASDANRSRVTNRSRRYRSPTNRRSTPYTFHAHHRRAHPGPNSRPRHHSSSPDSSHLRGTATLRLVSHAHRLAPSSSSFLHWSHLCGFQNALR